MNTKILINNSDSVVLFADETLVLTSNGLFASTYSVPFCNTTNSTLVDIAKEILPAHFYGGVFTYTSGVFTVFDTVRYTQIIAEYNLANPIPSDTSQFLALIESRAKALEAANKPLEAINLRNRYNV